MLPPTYLPDRQISVLRLVSDDVSLSPPDQPMDPRFVDDVKQLLNLGLLVRCASMGKLRVSEDGEQYLMEIDGQAG